MPLKHPVPPESPGAQRDTATSLSGQAELGVWLQSTPPFLTARARPEVHTAPPQSRVLVTL